MTTSFHLNRSRLAPPTFALLLLLASCAPGTALPRAGATVSQLQRVALNAYHRMEVAYLESGAYTTNALVDLELPAGVKWTLQEYDDEHYLLLFTSDHRPGEVWQVSPEGVTPVSAGVG